MMTVFLSSNFEHHNDGMPHAYVYHSDSENKRGTSESAGKREVVNWEKGMVEQFGFIPVITSDALPSSSNCIETGGC